MNPHGVPYSPAYEETRLRSRLSPVTRKGCGEPPASQPTISVPVNTHDAAFTGYSA